MNSMKQVRPRSEDVRAFILDAVAKDGRDVAKKTVVKFGISRQAANKHLGHLVSEGAISKTGNTTGRLYRLCALSEEFWRFSIADRPAEDAVWRTVVAPFLGSLPENVSSIWSFGFTEMFNNAVDHSEGRGIVVSAAKTAVSTEMLISDDGVGIFHKISEALNLIDERAAVLELAKGKMTTDPSKHTGEGIFFSSRMFDDFMIMAGDVCFHHRFKEEEDWVLTCEQSPGTFVRMRLSNHTSRTTRRVFDQYSNTELEFTKTVVPVRLARYEQEQLVSRSQGKRLMARVDKFRTVILDFEGVVDIGPAFADEIFRVFASEHSDIELVPLHASARVQLMIRRAQAHELAERNAAKAP